MSTRGSTKLALPPSGASGGMTGGAGPDPEVDKLQQDLVLLTQKIADITGEPQRAPPAPGSMKDSAGFVGGLRGMTEASGTSGYDHKMAMLNKVLGKISDLDRIVLKKTAPEKDVSARRGSRGMDLSSLPTHLHVTDRLLDLYTKTQRVTVIKTGGGSGGGAPESNGAAPGSPRSNKTNGADAKTIEKLQQKLEDSEAKRRAVAEDCSLSRKEISTLKAKLESIKSEKDDAAAALHDAAGATNDEVERLKAALVAAREETQACQESLEKETSRSLAAVKEVIARGMSIGHNNSNSNGNGNGNKDPSVSSSDAEMTTHTQNTTFTHSGEGQSDRGLSSEMQKALSLLDEGLSSREEGLREELVSINTVKETLESENNSLHLNMDLLNRDLLSVQGELEAIKVSYHTLHSETIGKEGAGAKAEKELKVANDKIVELQTELVNAARKTLELERLPLQLEQERHKSRLLEEDKIKFSADIITLKEEVAQYKHLNDSLKNKMREMSGRDASSREFLDSFEEVMQDELLAMKSAFEAKLKHKGEEADALSTRHRQEIQRLSANASPYLRNGA